jgi:hypothetical protein
MPPLPGWTPTREGRTKSNNDAAPKNATRRDADHAKVEYLRRIAISVCRDI